MVFRPVFSPLAVIALAAILGCGPPPRELSYRDLLTGPGLTSSRGEVPRELAMCAFENRFGQRLWPQEELAAELELGEAARLGLAGCSSHPDPELPRGADDDALELEIVGKDGAVLSERIPLPKTPGSWTRELELQLPSGAASLKVRVKLPSGRRSYLRDFYLRQRVAADQTNRGSVWPRAGEWLRRRRSPSEPSKDRLNHPQRRGDTSPRQILLISLDTLREDGLSRLGGPWPTPALDQLAARGQVFRPHYAAASWTKPSHASLLSGLSPEVHGGTNYNQPLPANLPWLPERLRKAGFATGGLVSDCLWLNPPFGFAKGFDDYQSVPWNLAQSARHALSWMLHHRHQDFFFFLHSFEAHSDFRTLPYEGPGVTRRVIEERFGVSGYGCREEQCASGILAEIDAGRMQPLPNEEAILRFLYGEGVRHVDAELGRLFTDLEEAGLFDDLLVVVTSDHGEAFFEHGRLLHGSHWNVILRVPLIVKWPRNTAAGEEVSQPTSALDLAPTLLAFAGLEADDLPGRNLGELRHSAPVFSWDPGLAVIAGSWKAVIDLKGGGRELYDLAADPGETVNLATERPEEMKRFEKLIRDRQAADHLVASRIARTPSSTDAPTLTPADIERLKALGYLGGPGGGE